jgi:RNA polymerase sigma-70 factor (ECF subfamily)
MENSNNTTAYLYPAIKRFVGKQIHQTDDRDDVVQNIFLKVHEKIHALNSDEKVRAWVYKIAQNAIYDFYRAQKGKENIDFARMEDIPFAAVETPNLQGCLHPFIQKLPASYAQAIELSEIQEMKLQDIATLLQVNLSTVKSRVQRGKKMIKDMFVSCCDFSINDKGKLIGEHKDPATCKICN